MKANILTLAVTLTLGVILAGSLLMPVISDAQTNLGTEVTLQNEAPASNFNYSEWKNEALTIYYAGGSHDVADMGTTYYLINGEASGINFVNVTQRILFASNEVCARVGGGSLSNVTIDLERIGTTSGVQQTEFEFKIEADGDYTLTLNVSSANPTVITGTITWCVYATPDGDMNILQLGNPNAPFYTSKASDIIVLGNVYTTGENDTFYSYYNGELYVNEDYADVSSVTISKTLSEGYTDIYDTTLVVNIGDESFTPFFILAPKNVNGHESSGAAYSLLGALPIMVIIGLVLAATAAIMVKRDD